MNFPTHRMQIADVTVSFAVPVDIAFDYLVDPENRPQWQSSLRRVDSVAAVGGRPGDRGTAWTDVTVVPGVAPQMEVTECVPGERWSEIGRWRFVDASLTLSFRDRSGGGSDVAAAAHLTVPTVIAPAVALLRIVTPAALRSDLRAAASILGSESNR